MTEATVAVRDFDATPEALEAAITALDDVGAIGGGVHAPQARRAAFATYRRLAARRARFPPRWRHDYAALAFEDVRWSTGRLAVPAAVRTARAEVADAPALALENLAGLVHAGGVLLVSGERRDDARFTLAPLADALRAKPSRAGTSLGALARASDDRFVALATAFQNCGAFVEVAADARLESPLQLLWLGRPGEASAIFPQTLVRVGANAHATIIERHAATGDSFVAGTVEIDLAPGAHLDYVVVQEAGDGARLAFRRASRCAAGSAIVWHLAEIGGALARSVLAADLRGAGASAGAYALSFAGGFANADLRVDVTHRAAETTSNVVVRRAAIDHGQGRFGGAIRIDAAAHRAHAALRDDGLALSRHAYLDTVPTLEIAGNDVSASHGATVGSLDEEALFYVESRGIARWEARRMIALAFFEPAIARFPSETLRDEVRTALDGRLDEVPETFAS